MEKKNMALSDDMLDQVIGGVGSTAASVLRMARTGALGTSGGTAAVTGVGERQATGVVQQALQNGGVISAGEGSLV